MADNEMGGTWKGAPLEAALLYFTGVRNAATVGQRFEGLTRKSCPIITENASVLLFPVTQYVT